MIKSNDTQEPRGRSIPGIKNKVNFDYGKPQNVSFLQFNTELLAGFLNALCSSTPNGTTQSLQHAGGKFYFSLRNHCRDACNHLSVVISIAGNAINGDICVWTISEHPKT